MSRIRRALGAAALAAMLAAPVAAQTPPASSSPSTVDKVKSWSEKKWDAAKAEFKKDKAKWDACNQRVAGEHLKGRASWSYVYDCMKS